MSTALPLRMTPEEFYAWEERQPEKHQYYKGEVFSMAGTSLEHNRITRNIMTSLDLQLTETDCEPFNLDLMVLTESDLRTYPDVVVICGKPEFDDKNHRVVKNPSIIFEVLSPSTEKYDRGLKFDHYKTISSLKEYFLISQDRLAVDHFVRTESGWLSHDYRSRDETISLTCARVTLKLQTIYTKIDFPPLEDPNVAQLKIYGDDR